MEELFLALLDRQATVLLDRVEAAVATLGERPAGEPLDVVVDAAVETVLAAGAGERAWWLVSSEQVLVAARSTQARAGRRLLIAEDDLALLVLAVHDGGVAQSLVDPASVPYGRLDRLALPPLLLGVTEPA